MISLAGKVSAGLMKSLWLPGKSPVGWLPRNRDQLWAHNTCNRVRDFCTLGNMTSQTMQDKPSGLKQQLWQLLINHSLSASYIHPQTHKQTHRQTDTGCSADKHSVHAAAESWLTNSASYVYVHSLLDSATPSGAYVGRVGRNWQRCSVHSIIIYRLILLSNSNGNHLTYFSRTLRVRVSVCKMCMHDLAKVRIRIRVTARVGVRARNLQTVHVISKLCMHILQNVHARFG